MMMILLFLVWNFYGIDDFWPEKFEYGMSMDMYAYSYIANKRIRGDESDTQAKSLHRFHMKYTQRHFIQEHF